jgi:hypothetical protein
LERGGFFRDLNGGISFLSPVFDCAQNLMSVVRQLQSYK